MVLQLIGPDTVHTDCWRNIRSAVRGNNPALARSLAGLAVELLQQGVEQVAPEELPDLLRFGADYYSWGFFDEGDGFLSALRRVVLRMPPVGHTRQIDHVSTMALCYRVLAGRAIELWPVIGAVAVEDLGADHAVTNGVLRYLAERGITLQQSQAYLAQHGLPRPGPPQGKAPPNQPPPNQPPPNPSPPAEPPTAAALSQAMALWTTLCFLTIAEADGTVGQAEVSVWQEIMRAWQLPDVWQQYGSERLHAMLRGGELDRLGRLLSSLDLRYRVQMGMALRAIVTADGVVHSDELEQLERCIRSLDLDLGQIGVVA